MESFKEDKKRILLVEDHPVVCQGLILMINQQEGLTVCGTADDYPTALAQVERQQPDLVIMDISLRSGNGLELLKALRPHYPKMAILMLSMHDENLYALRALRAGASGYVMKQESGDVVLIAIRQILSGEIYVSDNVGKRLKQQLFAGRFSQNNSTLETLSDRELEIFALLGEGLGTRQIANKLHLSIKTVESHRAHIKEKLSLRSGVELVQHAIQWKNSPTPALEAVS